MEKSVSQINFAALKINPVLGAKIIDYNGNVGFISLSVESRQTAELIQYLLKTLGAPAEVVMNERIDDAVNVASAGMLLKNLPQYTKVKKSDFGNQVLMYPQYLIWNKKDVVYQLILEPSNNLVGNKLNVFSKKSLKDKIIMGYHNPEQDPILSKYIK